MLLFEEKSILPHKHAHRDLRIQRTRNSISHHIKHTDYYSWVQKALKSTDLSSTQSETWFPGKYIH
jgi:hypothetical protein